MNVNPKAKDQLSAKDERPHILFVTFDAVGPLLGGSAMRVLGLARGLAELGHRTMLAAARVQPGHPALPFPVIEFNPEHARETLGPLVQSARVIVLPLFGIARFRFLRRAAIPLVFDLYDPIFFELLETGATAAELRRHRQVVQQVMRRGDFFITGSERQRDFWLGFLAASGRLSERNARDPARRGLIDVAGFGIDPTPPPEPSAARDRLITEIPALAFARGIVVWNGGIWDWTDPETLLKAMQILAQRRSGIHLILFAGTQTGVAPFGRSAAAQARSLSDQLGLTGECVHFIEHHIAFAERGNYLAGCDAAVSTHRANLESHFAYRTRFFDCFWAGLPLVCTAGDVIADLVSERGLGIVVPPENAGAIADALQRMTNDVEFARPCRERIAETRALFTWRKAVQALSDFCAAPRLNHISAPLADLRMLIESAASVLVEHGPRETWRRLQLHLRSR
ncbi:MAG: glycosyltransferase [Verrucomicrobia bacterium]|nr:glycosyltransferase [Verrucomicrobiota bacterium]